MIFSKVLQILDLCNNINDLDSATWPNAAKVLISGDLDGELNPSTAMAYRMAVKVLRSKDVHEKR